MKARTLMLVALILLPVMASADEKPKTTAASQDTQIFVYRMSETEMQKFLRGIQPDPVSPDAFRIAMNWELGRASIRIAAPKVSRKTPGRKTQNRTIEDCSDTALKDMLSFYERNDRCGAVFRNSPFREPPRAN